MSKIWIATGLAVFVILGLATVISVISRQHNKAQPAPVEVTQTAPDVRRAPPPAAREERAPPARTAETVPATPTPSPVAPPAVNDNRPALRLDRLAGTLRVNSRAILQDDRLDMAHSCYSMGQSMPVTWQGAPAGTKSFVLVLEERAGGEAPFVKWLAYNLPADRTGLPAAVRKGEQIPGGGLQGRNDHHALNYTGPCVPRGVVPYALRLFALDYELPVPAGKEFNDLIPAMNGHIIDMAERDFIFYNRK